ncbi:PREDICTED: integrin alpha-PS2-like [Priapulus caudatus]|uniref:Integrin alpha-PS2-like n=1 Tax=Priapulus caudatus TaxID=37621 RepID=A0ABM1ETA1_PRICU|nr:PREDICTED: integrin alpha-PS2-like [Priapulus caudatus]
MCNMAMQCTFARVVAVVVCLLNAAAGFNVDLRTLTMHKGPSDSLFGFSIAQHVYRGESWLLVGAPKTQTNQPGITQGGAVFRCRPEETNDCQIVPFDTQGNNVALNGPQWLQIDEKSHQWFGASVQSGGPDGYIMACAPRYVYFSVNFQRREPVGACFATKDMGRGNEYAPCRTAVQSEPFPRWGYHRQGFCQAGFSLQITDDERAIVGAIGSWYWQGQVYSQNLNKNEDLKATNEGPATEDDSYLAFATDLGEFNGDNSQDIVAGMPKWNLTGQVVVMDTNLGSLHNMTGEQYGSSYGAAVAATDLNGDGLDDVVVGAPYFYKEDEELSYETGRVYIYYQNKRHHFPASKTVIIDGDDDGGRFGQAISAIGDVDQDGYNDIAIAAPYGGKRGRGIVYIYHGSKKGLVIPAVQVILAEDVSRRLHAFGYSLAGGMDLDGNEYPDFSVGAYESDRIVHFKSRPVVTFEANLKINPNDISLDEQGCRLRDNTYVPCVVVTSCLQYYGKGTPQQLVVNVTQTLDVKKAVGQRLFFQHNEGKNVESSSIRLMRETKWCRAFHVYLRTNVRDKLSPITVEVKYNMVDTEPEDSLVLRPIQNSKVDNYVHKQVNIQKDCGQDNICIPDLQVTAKTLTEEYQIGTSDDIFLDISVVNANEDAFEAQVLVAMPDGVDFIKLVKGTGDDSANVLCSYTTLKASENDTEQGMIVCDVGNPLSRGHGVDFKLKLNPGNINGSQDELQFIVQANSSNPEHNRTMYDNVVPIIIPVKVSTKIKMTGISEPEQVIFPSDYEMTVAPTTEEEIGPEITHVYEVQNIGNSLISQGEVKILWPSFTKLKGHLLYLIATPIVVGGDGTGSCQANNVNPARVKALEKTKTIEELIRRNRSETTEGKTSSPSSSSSLNTVEEKHSVKVKRATSEERLLHVDELEGRLKCENKECAMITCSTGQLEPTEYVVIFVRSRLWLETLVAEKA